MLSDFKKSPEAKRIIREKEKQLSEKAAKFPFKTKLNYAVDAEYGSGVSARMSSSSSPDSCSVLILHASALVRI